MNKPLKRNAEWSLFDNQGRRKYITRRESQRVLSAAGSVFPISTYLLVWFLLATGARISEALAVRPRHVDSETASVVLFTLKKRGNVQEYRILPLPHELIEQLERYQMQWNIPDDGFVWPFNRITAWRRIKEVMLSARVPPFLAHPKALRHGYCTNTLEAGTPMRLTKDAMGHSSIETTEIYADVKGAQARAYAERYWEMLKPGYVPPEKGVNLLN